MTKLRKIWIVTVSSTLEFCLLLIAIPVSNLLFRNHRSESTQTVEVLTQVDKIRIAKALHLRRELGDTVWPGWGSAIIPSILYNENHVFLVGYSDPPTGWFKIPAGPPRGGPWEIVPEDAFLEEDYYRHLLSDSRMGPEVFTVQVGDRWVASMPTYSWMKVSLQKSFENDLPPYLQPIFPYQLFIKQLVSSSDKYISLSSHEAFHAYQGMDAPEKLARCEYSSIEFEDQYPWGDVTLQADWQMELDLLEAMLRTDDESRLIDLVKQFLLLRSERREKADLSRDVVKYEQQREWLEGLARYAELEIWRQAFLGNYQPVREVVNLSDFNNYSGYQDRWERELDQIVRTADDTGDGRFYYSGMAQAFLLDQLLPGWKLRAFEQDVWLEDLLAEAIGLHD